MNNAIIGSIEVDYYTYNPINSLSSKEFVYRIYNVMNSLLIYPTQMLVICGRN